MAVAARTTSASALSADARRHVDFFDRSISRLTRTADRGYHGETLFEAGAGGRGGGVPRKGEPRGAVDAAGFSSQRGPDQWHADRQGPVSYLFRRKSTVLFASQCTVTGGQSDGPRSLRARAAAGVRRRPRRLPPPAERDVPYRAAPPCRHERRALLLQGRCLSVGREAIARAEQEAKPARLLTKTVKGTHVKGTFARGHKIECPQIVPGTA